MKLFSGFTLSLRFAIINIVFALYVLFLQPKLVPFLRSTADNTNSGPNPVIGALLLGALLLEVPGLYYRMKQVGNRLLALYPKRAGSLMTVPYIILPVILHTALGVIITIFAFRSFGFGLHTDEWMFRLFFIFALVREGIIIYILYSRKVPVIPVPMRTLTPFITDGILFYFNCIAFTATWEVISKNNGSESSLASAFLYFFFASILFLMFYLPCNLTYLAEDFLMLRGKREVFMRVAALIMVTVSAVGPMAFRDIVHDRSADNELTQIRNRNEEVRKKIIEERRIMEQRRQLKQKLHEQ